MTALETRAREQILEAAAQLVEEGLIARTWGNISARVSDTQFLITPSGLAYESLREDLLVLVNITDGSCTGLVKPSSEKGIHADAYRLRPEVDFVIHTHQHWASVAGIEGRALTGFIHPLLGKRVPCAAYGLPGTKALRRAMAEEVAAWPDCRAFLLRHHGALCLGRDREDAFAAARALEEVAEAKVRDVLEDQKETSVPSADGMPSVEAILKAARRVFPWAKLETARPVVAASAERKRMRPWLDDLAQIAGADIRCVPAEPERAVRALRGRNAVLLRGVGALCVGKTEEDVDAVRMLLRKNCDAQLYAGALPGCRPLSGADALLQRLIYRASYEKKKGPC